MSRNNTSAESVEVQPGGRGRFSRLLSRPTLGGYQLLAIAVCAVFLLGTFGAPAAYGQSISAGTIDGTVVDANGGAVANANVTIENSRTAFTRSTTTAADGTFRFNDVPLNPYKLTATAENFGSVEKVVEIRSAVPLAVSLTLPLKGTNLTVDVNETSINENLENVPMMHQDISGKMMSTLSTYSPGSELSDVIAKLAPGVAADSNGFIHPLGDHAQVGTSLDNQPITDQQSKAFSTQLPINIFQSLEVITGATPAEFGDKTSLVINAVTKSGLGQTTPTGSFSSGYGKFGTVTESADLAFGGPKFGNFIAFNFDRSGRFLDAPEFTVLHDQGKNASLFDRFDYSPSSKDTFHLNVFVARNNFQIANTFEQQALGQDQRQNVRSLDIAPGFVHIFSPTTVLTVNPYYRVDLVQYFPSANPFSDQTQTIAQQRRLNNVGIRADLAYDKGIHNAKFGVQFSHTFLREGFQFGITDPAFNSPCLDPTNDTCTADTGANPANPNFLPGLQAFDLTRGGNLFRFNGRTDVKQEAVYAQDLITHNQLSVSLGLRFDDYHGLSHGNAVQPRLGVAYLFKPTGTVLRGSYTRNFETPYNENLILSSATGAGGLADTGVLDPTGTSNQPLKPGYRNQFNAGLEQAITRRIVVDLDYFIKRTTNAYDFNAILNTPITFPISWSLSKIDGVSARVNLSDYHGFSAYFVAGHTRARYFPPESGGLFFNSALPTGPFRIDHDQNFQQTTEVQYQFHNLGKMAPWISMSWQYESGLVSGSVPDFATALTFSPDQQGQIGLFCGALVASFANGGFSSCSDPNHGALKVRIPADGAENDDHNPPRIAPRNLFDLSVGTNNLLRTERVRLTMKLTAINITNRQALYNFNSTFSGTHFVTPRSYFAQLGVAF